MRNTLVLPDGVRLARKDELPGSGPERAAAWARIRSASMASGFALQRSNDPRFALYAEINVDAPRLWSIFRDLCAGFHGPTATLVIGNGVEGELTSIGPAGTSIFLALLERHQYQLANDGLIEFGLVERRQDLLTEVFVAPTKHLKVWVNEEGRFRSILQGHRVPEADRLAFLDEFPRTTTRLPRDKAPLADHRELIEYVRREIAAYPSL